MNFLSLFSGIGGLDLGLERAGMRCVGQVEIGVYPQSVLGAHWPDVPRFKDVRTVTHESFSEPIDLIAGGFPCQDVSTAGGRSGIAEGTRSGLWFEFARLVRELRPRYVLVENVAALLVPNPAYPAPIGRVLGDLAECGFDAEWRLLDARFFGVPQQRRRVFILAYPRGTHRLGVLHSDAFDAAGNRPRLDAACDGSPVPHDQAGGAGTVPVHPYDPRAALFDDWRNGVDGRLSDWMAAYKGVGNAVVPQVAEWIGRRILAAEQRERGAA